MAATLSMHQLLGGMAKFEASDLHLKVGYPPYYRVAGSLRKVETDPIATTEQMEQMVLPLAPPSRRKQYEDLGDLDFSWQDDVGDRFRINIFRSTTHMHAAFKTATFHFHNDTETWKSDVVHEQLQPINGFIRVPEKPGLGLTLNRGELNRLKALELAPQAKWIVKTRFKNGTMMYNIADPKQSIFMVRPDVRRLIPMRYDAPVETEYWDDDGTPQYREMFARIEREGIVLEGP